MDLLFVLNFLIYKNLKFSCNIIALNSVTLKMSSVAKGNQLQSVHMMQDYLTKLNVSAAISENQLLFALFR